MLAALLIAAALGQTPASLPGPDYWAHGRITFHVAISAPSLPADRAERCYRAGAALWSEVSGVEPTFVADPSAAVVRARAGAHDGPGGGAWAISDFPSARGYADQTFDSAESWHTLDDAQLAALMAHEIGHALGLEHSGDPTSIMYPLVRIGVTRPNAADAAAMRARYGPPKGPR